jgi:predicted lysophospholipase L1 biosynthesis ABC-type transport system permease subunit
MHELLFRGLLRLLPEEFRAAYARDMQATFRAERGDAGGALSAAATAWLWAATAWDVVRAAFSEHADILARDTRYALRTLRARPAHTLTVATVLLCAFAATALTMALVGLYGALGVYVGQRRQEIGVRLALGAPAAAIRRMVLGQGMRPAVAGLVAGLFVAALSVGVLRTLLHGVRTLDPETLAAAAVVLLASTIAACFVPAWRASRIDPAATLRTE